MIFNRPDESGHLPCRPQNGVEQDGAGGFAVRSGHRRQYHSLIRLIKEVACCKSQSMPAVCHLNPRAAEACRRRSVAYHRQCSLFHSRACKLRAVRPAAWKCKKQISGPYFTAVVGQAMHLLLTQNRRQRGQGGNAFENSSQLHPETAREAHADVPSCWKYRTR